MSQKTSTVAGHFTSQSHYFIYYYIVNLKLWHNFHILKSNFTIKKEGTLVNASVAGHFMCQSLSLPSKTAVLSRISCEADQTFWCSKVWRDTFIWQDLQKHLASVRWSNAGLSALIKTHSAQNLSFTPTPHHKTQELFKPQQKEKALKPDKHGIISRADSYKFLSLRVF